MCSKTPTTVWVSIPTLSGINCVKEVTLSEPEEVRRNEYRHSYSDGDAWLPVYRTREEAEQD